MRLICSMALVTLVGSTALWSATDGLRAFTSEEARRLAVLQRPVEVPRISLHDHRGDSFSFEAYGGRVLLVDFIYSRCTSQCLVASARFRELHNRLAADARADDIHLLSISFDPAHDTGERLADYAERFNANGLRWRMARVSNPAELPSLLDAFGIVVIPDGRGEFEHNGGVHIVDRRGRLVRILDNDAPYDEVRNATAGL